MLSDGDDPTPGLLAMLVVLAGTALLLIAWLPEHEHRAEAG